MQSGDDFWGKKNDLDNLYNYYYSNLIQILLKLDI